MKIMRDQVWTEEVKSGELNVGFTRGFIENKLTECFHVLQADSTHLFEGSPMLVIETNDGLESIKSPITGTVITFNAKARNFPDRITEDDVILTVVPKGIKVAVPKKVARTLEETRDEFARFGFNEAVLAQLNRQENRRRGFAFDDEEV